MVNRRLVQTADMWHGGQSSALYSFMSTGGVIHTEEHRTNLLVEIDSCIEWCQQPERIRYYTRDIKNLTTLKLYIEKTSLLYCYNTGMKYEANKH